MEVSMGQFRKWHVSLLVILLERTKRKAKPSSQAGWEVKCRRYHGPHYKSIVAKEEREFWWLAISLCHRRKKYWV